MAIVDLKVLQVRGKWTVKLHDARGVQYLGATRSRGEIEAFTARLMADLVAQGDCPLLKVAPLSPSHSARNLLDPDMEEPLNRSRPPKAGGR